MQRTRLVVTSILLLTMFGCASQDELDSVRRDTDEMKSRIFTLDKGLSEVRGEVKEGVEKSLSGYRQNMDAMQKEVAGFQKDMATIRKEGADLQATLDNARVDMQLLTGKIDDVRIMAQKPAEDLALLKDDLNKRLAALDERLSKLEKGLTDQQKQAAQPQSPEALYQQGQEAVKSGDTAKGREILSKFLDQYPSDKLAVNAHYWMGESYYTDKNYDQAILEFQEVIKTYPRNKEKVPAAMLKQWMAFKAMGDSKSAAYVYRKLIEDFPKSEEARVAREKVRGK